MELSWVDVGVIAGIVTPIMLTIESLGAKYVASKNVELAKALASVHNLEITQINKSIGEVKQGVDRVEYKINGHIQWHLNQTDGKDN